MDINGIINGIPAGKHSHSELENGPVEIVEFPS